MKSAMNAKPLAKGEVVALQIRHFEVTREKAKHYAAS
jgi:hypothetical protein